MRRGHIGLIAIVSEWAGALTTASMHFRLEQARLNRAGELLQKYLLDFTERKVQNCNTFLPFSSEESSTTVREKRLEKTDDT